MKAALLPGRQLQCYKCLEFGHVRQMCKNSVDRSNLCYRYGRTGHLSCLCTSPARCVLCAERVLPFGSVVRRAFRNRKVATSLCRCRGRPGGRAAGGGLATCGWKSGARLLQCGSRIGPRANACSHCKPYSGPVRGSVCQ